MFRNNFLLRKCKYKLAIFLKLVGTSLAAEEFIFFLFLISAVASFLQEFIDLFSSFNFFVNH